MKIAETGLVRGLGWISLAMDLTLLAPTRAARLFGVGPRPWLMSAIGARDLVIGLGLLRGRQQELWLRVHALADAVDGTFVAIGLLTRSLSPHQGSPWLALAAGGGWVSITRAKELAEADRCTQVDIVG